MRPWTSTWPRAPSCRPPGSGNGSARWPIPATCRMTERSPWRRPRRAHFPGVPAWGSPVAKLPDEPFETSQLGLMTGDMTDEWAWGGADGAGVRVCLLDSGVDASHPRVGTLDRAMEV